MSEPIWTKKKVTANQSGRKNSQRHDQFIKEEMAAHRRFEKNKDEEGKYIN